MDHGLYIAMSGARQTMLAQAANTHNLANVSTPGFREDLTAMRAMSLYGPGLPSRAYAMAERPAVNFESGPINTTGRDLDVAMAGEGWLAVQAADGHEAYTRNGNLRVSTAGLLVTGAGYPVMGEGGPISLPPADKIEINDDGTISIVPSGEEPNTLVVVDRLKLVNPEAAQLVKGLDGLIHHRDDIEAEPDENVRLVAGALEGSNVSAVEAMVNMIDLARRFEMQVKMMQTTERNDEADASLLRLS